MDVSENPFAKAQTELPIAEAVGAGGPVDADGGPVQHGGLIADLLTGGWRESTYRYFPRTPAASAEQSLEPRNDRARLPLAVALIYIALAEMTAQTGWIRVALVIAGLIVLYFAIASLLRRVVGATVNVGLWFASGWMGLTIISALTAGLLPLSESKSPSKTLMEPVLARPDLFSKHPLGTDRQGLDMLGGVIYGVRTSLTIGLGVVFLGLLIGGTIGLIAGYRRGRVDQTLEFFTNSMLAFPPLILLMGVAAVMERNVMNITIALTIVAVPTYIRLARANTMVVGQREFVLAARALGLKDRTIVVRDVAPNVMKPLLSYALVITAVVIVAEASLSFLGLGIPRLEPTLGNMIAPGQSDFATVPHLVFVPATVLFLTVLSLNRLGEEAQQRWGGS